MIWQLTPMICQETFHHFGSIQTQDTVHTIGMSSFGSLTSLQFHPLSGKAQVLTDGRGGELLYALGAPTSLRDQFWIQNEIQIQNARRNSIVCIMEITPNNSISEKPIIISALCKASTLKLLKCIAVLLKRLPPQSECLLIYNLDIRKFKTN